MKYLQAISTGKLHRIFTDRTGQRYGRLLVLSLYDMVKNADTRWLCRCDCGNEHVARSVCLQGGSSRSCGCLAKEVMKAVHTTHGETIGGKDTREFRAWRAMRRRCYDTTRQNYAAYGGRGIKVCKRWLVFENFLADMGRCPTGLTLDRINTNGNYEPGNCRWADWTTQSRNKRTSVLIAWRGTTMNAVDWAIACGLERTKVANRLSRGWPVERALTTP